MARGHRQKPGKDKRKKTTRKPQKSAIAQRGKELSEVREGTPLQIERLLKDREKASGVNRGIFLEADGVGLQQSEELLDAEIDFFDEDELPSDNTPGKYQMVVLGSGSWERVNSAFDPVQKFELCVRMKPDGNVSCNIWRDPRIGFDCDSVELSDKLNEFASRYDVLGRLGVWLATERCEFLRTGDWWDFAEKALDEAEENQSSVVQEDLINIAKLGCRSDSLSRFIKNVVLSWGPNGSMDIGLLFSKEAKCAWVARAYREFCMRIKKDMHVALETLRGCSASKKNEAARRKGDLMSMSSRWVAERLCSLAHVKGADVVGLYEQKILEV